MRDGMVTIAVDFDGCLVTHEYPEIGQPNFRVISKLIVMRKNGAILILWTCRSGKELQEAVDACKRWGLEFDAVNENYKPSPDFNPRKVVATYYLDDRAVNVKDF